LPIDAQLAAMRRREARLREANPVVGVLLPGPVGAVEPVPALTSGQRAEAFLRDNLAGGQVPSVEVKARAKQAGIAWRTLRRAAERLGIKHTRNRDKTWNWKLPE
jgi:hypothetical protein